MFCENPVHSVIFGILSGFIGGSIAIVVFPTIAGAVVFSAIIATIAEIANHAGVFNELTQDLVGKAVIILGSIVTVVGLMTIRASGPEPLFLDGTVLTTLPWWTAPIIMGIGLTVMAVGGLQLSPAESDTMGKNN